jgi:PAS domain S-box-containing protein
MLLSESKEKEFMFNKYKYSEDEVIQEISLLYELALSIGQSLDLKENCERFLTTLLSRKNIDIASVWLKNELLGYQQPDDFTKVFGFPALQQKQKNIKSDHLIPLKLAEHRHIFCSDEQSDFLAFITEKRIKGGAYAVFNLANIGFLKLYSSNGLETLNPFELNKLQKVIDKFAIVLKACLYYDKSALVTARLSTLIESMQTGLLLEDEERKINLVNPIFCELFNIPLPPHSLIGLDCEEAMYQIKEIFDDGDAFIQRVNELLYEKKLVINEEINLKDGRVFARNYIPIWQNNKYLGHLWKYSDITSQKRNLQIIQENEAKLRVVINSALDAVILINQQSEIIEWNAQAEKIFGWAKSEVVGKQMADFIIPEKFKVAHHNGMAHFLKTGEGPVLNQRIEVPALRKNGEEFLIELSITPVKINNIFYFSAFARDITERKQAEKELILAKQKAEDAANSKQNFLSTVSHEIRTPMNAIIGMSRLLEKTQLNGKQHEYLKAIKTSGDNLLVIINDILDVTKIEAGKMELENVGFQLKDVLNDLRNATRFKADEKDLDLQLHIDKEIAEVLIGDPVRLFQILLNLTNNAIKFTQKGFVRVECNILSTMPDLNVIEFKVTDTGKGIQQDKIYSIFESFTQEDSSIHREYGGTGLGLSISKKLIELFGGKIRVNSQIGAGSVFSFVLVFKLGTKADLVKKDEILYEENKLEGLRILLVEDNEINQFYARTILDEWGVLIDIVDDGRKAVEIAQAKEFDLILMDMQLPIMDGLEATKIIRNTLHLDLPILALTANAIKGDYERCLEVGMNGYVSKPFVPNELFNKIAYLTKNTDKKNTISNENESDFTQSNTKNLIDKPYPDGNSKENKLDEHTRLPDKQQSTANEKLYSFNKLIVSFKDNNMVNKMARIFLEKTPASLEEIEDNFKKGNLAQVARLTHKIKSSIDLMDINSITEDIRILENSVVNPLDKNTLQKALQNVKAVCEKVFLQLRNENIFG